MIAFVVVITEQDGNVTAVGVSQDGLKVLLASDQVTQRAMLFTCLHTRNRGCTACMHTQLTE